MRQLRFALPILLVVLIVAGCGHKRQAAPEPAEPAVLHVENHNWLDVDIYVLRSGQRIRLGSVNATTSKDFIFPRWVVAQLGTIQLIADPVGSPAAVLSESIAVRPGTHVSWTLESSLGRSTLSVY